MNTPIPSRRLVLFCGPQRWGENAVAKLISSSDLSAEQIYWHQQKDNALGILGQDRALVIINAYDGLNPDVIGRVSGTLIGGGALAIICPNLADWPEFPDPQAAKLIPYPGQHNFIKSHYLQRWSKLLSTLDGIECYSPSDTQAIKPIVSIHPRHRLDKAYTADQQAAIDALIKSTTGQRRRPVIITADRGRGKSAAMGLAAANLMTTSKARHIIITSSGFNKVRNLFKHAHAALTDSLLNIEQKSLQHSSGSIRYVAPETLINGKTKQQLDCDLLLVDEAASLGVASLEKLLIHFSRIAFASTEHGYEGSGRGFSLKFKQLINTHCRGHYSVVLETPIRWADQDPLEQWINQLLLLKASHSPPELAATAPLTTLDFEPISQQALTADEMLLQRVFHLLIDAHYQTRPLDLRYLLDAPNSQLWLARADQQIAGLVWLMHEGGLDQDIAGEIVAGRRRPQGHLVPQIMAAHMGLSDAVTLHCARIQRIVVDPGLQDTGIGSWMLDQLKQRLSNSTDYLASSFGADLPLLRFWNRAEFGAMRLSDKSNAASGLHSALVLHPLTEPATQLWQTAQNRFSHQFPLQLASSLQQLSPALACELARHTAITTEMSTPTLEAAVLFAYAARPYESSLSAMQQLALIALFKSPLETDLSPTQRHLFIMRSLQHQNWHQCARQLGLSGKAECVQLLRQGAQKMLMQCHAHDQIVSLKAKFNLLA